MGVHKDGLQKDRDSMVQKDSAEQPAVAVALGYDQNTMTAPQVLASGKGLVAERIIQIAREHNITVEKDPVLAQALGQLDLGQEIPPELYKVVAEVLVFLMETDRKTKPKVR